MAFILDIDGILVYGNCHISEGKRLLDIINGDNKLCIKITHIFLTKDSGKPKQARVKQLPKILKIPILTEQFIQPHTPLYTH
jgi:ribonucleotide monophosphatase NagD (HAD superfamily)